MKRIITASVVAALAVTSVQAESLSERLDSLETQLAKVKKKLKKQNKKINAVKAHDSGDNIKWGVDLRTSIDNINYDMADGGERGKNDLMATRLWLNMAYAPDASNVFKGQLSYNKAWGADLGQTTTFALNQFGQRGMGYDTFNWLGNEALTNDNLKVRQAYWLYLGENAFGLDMPWTFSLGRRPSTGGFLANLREDDAAQSPLGHIINVEFDGLSSKLDLSKVTGVPGMSFKVCAGQGSTNATPMLSRLDGTQYSNDDNSMDDIKLGGFIFEPYNDGQIITKATWFRAYDLPGFDGAGFMTAFADDPTVAPATMTQVGDMEGGALSVLIDGVTEDGYFADVKVFGSIAYSKTSPKSGINPNTGQAYQMLGMTMPNAFNAFGMGDPTQTFGAAPGESNRGTSYWFGATAPVLGGTLGVEYNHGSEYWRPFDYAEDTMIGSKLAARGSAIEAYFTYNITEALSAQLRYTKIDYDYAGSNGFFASGGTPFDIDQVKDMAEQMEGFLAGPDTMPGTLAWLQANPDYGVDAIYTDQVDAAEAQAGMMISMEQNIVEAAQDVRFYLRYRF